MGDCHVWVTHLKDHWQHSRVNFVDFVILILYVLIDWHWSTKRFLNLLSALLEIPIRQDLYLKHCSCDGHAEGNQKKLYAFLLF